MRLKDKIADAVAREGAEAQVVAGMAKIVETFGRIDRCVVGIAMDVRLQRAHWEIAGGQPRLVHPVGGEGYVNLTAPAPAICRSTAR